MAQLEALILCHIDASVESFEVFLPRHRVLLLDETLATQLGLWLGSFGIVTLTREGDYSRALALSFEQPRPSVMVFRC